MQVPRSTDSKVDLIAQIESPEFPVQYPHVVNRHLLDPSAQSAMEYSWSRKLFETHPIRIFKLRNVFVAGEGIVFDRSGRHDPQFITQQANDHIARAQSEVLQAISDNHFQVKTDPCVLCVKPGWQNYGHWLMEMLPVANIVNRVVDSSRLKFLVSGGYPEAMKRVVRQSLDLCAVPEPNIEIYGHVPTFFETLYCVQGLTMHGIYMSPLVFNAIDKLSEPARPTPSRRLYIKRGEGLSRSIVNAGAFEKRLLAQGFSVIEPEKLDFAEQIAQFKGAESIVGIAGAGMTNIAFSGSNANVVILYPQSMPDTFFFFIATHRHLNLTDVRCQEVDNSLTHNSWDRKITLSEGDIDAIIARALDGKA